MNQRSQIKRSRSRSTSIEEDRPKRKMSKHDSLKPISNFLEAILSTHGLSSLDARHVVTGMTDRLVTAGHGWDKMLQFHAKVVTHTNFCINKVLNFYRAVKGLSRS